MIYPVAFMTKLFGSTEKRNLSGSPTPLASCCLVESVNLTSVWRERMFFSLVSPVLESNSAKKVCPAYGMSE